MDFGQQEGRLGLIDNVALDRNILVSSLEWSNKLQLNVVWLKNFYHSEPFLSYIKYAFKIRTPDELRTGACEKNIFFKLGEIWKENEGAYEIRDILNMLYFRRYFWSSVVDAWWLV